MDNCMKKHYYYHYCYYVVVYKMISYLVTNIKCSFLEASNTPHNVKHMLYALSI